MPAAVIGEIRYLVGDQWKRYGRADIAAPNAAGGGTGNPRDTLILGAYIPGYDADTVGVRSGGARTQQYGTGGVFTPTVNTTYTNVDFWCKVAASNTAGGANQGTYNNCGFFNQKPEDMYAASASTNGGCVQNFGTDPAHLNFLDCTFNPKAWFDAGLSAYWGHPVQVGIHGGNFTARRCEWVNCQDGINYVGPSSTPAADNAFCLMEACQIHAAFYLKPWSGPGAPTSGDTHSDGFQFNTGKNITIRYCMIGGHVDTVGYNTWKVAGDPPSYNSGDDNHNSAIIIQQEGSGTLDYAWVENVIVEYCWLAGGAATLNANYKFGNPGADWIFRYNKFGNPRNTTAWAGAGYTIYWHGSLTWQLVGNVGWDGTQANLNGNGSAALMSKYPGT